MKKTVSLVTSSAKQILFSITIKTVFLICPELIELCPCLWTSCYGQERKPHALSACGYWKNTIHSRRIVKWLKDTLEWPKLWPHHQDCAFSGLNHNSLECLPYSSPRDLLFTVYSVPVPTQFVNLPTSGFLEKSEYMFCITSSSGFRLCATLYHLCYSLPLP